MDFNLIVEHPDRKEIISRLVGGDLPKSVAQWLKIRYTDPEDRHLHISSTLLQQYIENHVDLLGQLQADIKKHNSLKVNDELSTLTKSNKTYKSVVAELADNELDVKKMINEIVMVIRTRTEQVFDKIQKAEDGKEYTGKGDYQLIKYFEVLLNAVEKLDKINNNAAETKIENSYTIKYIDQNVFIFQEALRETLAEFDLDVSMRFMERFVNKLTQLKPPDVASNQQRYNDSKALMESTKVVIEGIVDE